MDAMQHHNTDVSYLLCMGRFHSVVSIVSLCLQRTAGGKLGVKAPFIPELLQICDSIWVVGKQVLHLRGEDPTAAPLTCCRDGLSRAKGVH